MKHVVSIATSNQIFTPLATDVIQVRGLHKHYGRQAAHEGEMFGLIGPDGAGKTTTFQILGSLIEAQRN